MRFQEGGQESRSRGSLYKNLLMESPGGMQPTDTWILAENGIHILYFSTLE